MSLRFGIKITCALKHTTPKPIIEAFKMSFRNTVYQYEKNTTRYFKKSPFAE